MSAAAGAGAAAAAAPAASGAAPTDVKQPPQPQPQNGNATSAAVTAAGELLTESYAFAREMWPRDGNHILAQYHAPSDSVVVYQAFRKSIGEYAAKHQKFTGCPDYSVTRMTWIKTNFLWMQYRSGWGSKSGQDVTLAIWLKRTAFERLLSDCVHSSWAQAQGSGMTEQEFHRASRGGHARARIGERKAKKNNKNKANSKRMGEESDDDDAEAAGDGTAAEAAAGDAAETKGAAKGAGKGGNSAKPVLHALVRLQWDPDHHPNGSPHKQRRAIQLGLKNVTGFADGTDIVCIRDISAFVKAQSKCTETTEVAVASLTVPRERVFVPSGPDAQRIIKHLQLSNTTGVVAPASVAAGVAGAEPAAAAGAAAAAAAASKK